MWQARSRTGQSVYPHTRHTNPKLRNKTDSYTQCKSYRMLSRCISNGTCAGTHTRGRCQILSNFGQQSRSFRGTGARSAGNGDPAFRWPRHRPSLMCPCWPPGFVPTRPGFTMRRFCASFATFVPPLVACSPSRRPPTGRWMCTLMPFGLLERFYI